MESNLKLENIMKEGTIPKEHTGGRELGDSARRYPETGQGV